MERYKYIMILEAPTKLSVAVPPALHLAKIKEHQKFRKSNSSYRTISIDMEQNRNTCCAKGSPIIVLGQLRESLFCGNLLEFEVH